ncbi:BrnT family toxin [Cyanothece sp. BG0011]|uniref:BrnT family toxin n=1 Tax=Cyanothece sp. BG0011 TaxID=2082950 RepID=UPI000D1EDADF|nr:BrnT family toxin [Cyanothece sp. BG0011]
MNIPQVFEWDENKRQANIEKHGIDFADIRPILSNPIIEFIDNRKDYGEIRTILLGQIEGRVLYVVYTQRGSIKRIISARKANKREQRKYYESNSPRMGSNEGSN